MILSVSAIQSEVANVILCFDYLLDSLDNGGAVNAVHLHEDGAGTTASNLGHCKSADDDTVPASIDQGTTHCLSKTT